MIRNLIGKDWRTPVDGVASLPVFNPATGEVIEQVPLSGDPAVDAAGIDFYTRKKVVVTRW